LTYTQKPAAKTDRKTGRPAGQKTVVSDPHAILLHPIVTEKTMRLMDENNCLEFLVRRTASKGEVKASVEQLFSCKVATVNTRITKDGKRAIVKFGGETSAEDIGMRIGVF
jgi:large subunit ribosomal protein L23